MAVTITFGSVYQRIDGSKLVAINYTGTDSGNFLNDLIVYEFSTDNINWATMTAKTTDSAHSGISNLAFTSGGASFAFIWDVIADLGLSYEDLTVWVRLQSQNQDGPPAQSALTSSGSFAIDTKAPVVTSFSFDSSSLAEFVPYTPSQDLFFTYAVTTNGIVNLVSDITGATEMRFTLSRDYSRYGDVQNYGYRIGGSTVSGQSYVNVSDSGYVTSAADIGKYVTIYDGGSGQILNPGRVGTYAVTSVTPPNLIYMSDFTAANSSATVPWAMTPAWSSWEPYSSVKAGFDVTNPALDGDSTKWVKRVTSQYRDSFGNVTYGNCLQIWYKDSPPGVKNYNDGTMYHHWKNALAVPGNTPSTIIEMQDNISYPTGIYIGDYYVHSHYGTMRVQSGKFPKMAVGYGNYLVTHGNGAPEFIMTAPTAPTSHVNFGGFTIENYGVDRAANIIGTCIQTGQGDNAPPISYLYFKNSSSLNARQGIVGILSKTIQHCFFDWDCTTANPPNGRIAIKFASGYGTPSIRNCILNLRNVTNGILQNTGGINVPWITNTTIRKGDGFFSVIYVNTTINVRNLLVCGDGTSGSYGIVVSANENINLNNCTFPVGTTDARFYPPTSIIGFNDNSAVDALLVNDSMSPSTPEDFRLTAGSPCIDTGISTPYEETWHSGVPQTDFWDMTRPYGAGIDRGAHEWQPSVITFDSTPMRNGNYVTSTIDTSALVALTSSDPYFDSTSKVYRTDLIYTDPWQRENHTLVHMGDNQISHNAWSATAKPGNWALQRIKVKDPEGAVTYVDRTSFGPNNDFSLA